MGRGLDYLSYHHAVWRAACDLAGPGDLLIAKTDPPLLSLPAMHAASRRGARLINWLQDLYPEVATALGVPLLRGPLARGLARLRNRSLHGAAANIAIGEAMAKRLRQLGVPAQQIRVIPNWSDDEAIVPLSRTDNPLRRAWNLEGKFIVGYSGNFGRAQDFGDVLAAAERLRHHAGIVFVLIGGGPRGDTLHRQVEQRGLESTVRFFPYQDRANLPHSLALPDLHWLSHRPGLEGLIFPSKFYGIAAAGRPMLASAAPTGEVGTLLTRYGCGVAVEPGNAAQLASTIATLAADIETCAEMGRRSRAMLETGFTRRRALLQWEDLIDRQF